VFYLRHPVARAPSITQALPPDHPIRSTHTTVRRQIRIPPPSSAPPPLPARDPSSSLYAPASSSAQIRGGPGARARRHGRRSYTAVRARRPRPRPRRGCERPNHGSTGPKPKPWRRRAIKPRPHRRAWSSWYAVYCWSPSFAPLRISSSWLAFFCG
jgi:hypothetical protein